MTEIYDRNPQRKWSPTLADTALKLWDNGWSGGMIAERPEFVAAGLNRNAVIGKVHRLKHPEKAATYLKPAGYKRVEEPRKVPAVRIPTAVPDPNSARSRNERRRDKRRQEAQERRLAHAALNAAAKDRRDPAATGEPAGVLAVAPAGCRFPVSPDGAPETLFCNADATQTRRQSDLAWCYCAFHRRKMFRKKGDAYA
jgi:hypothetical protein